MRLARHLPPPAKRIVRRLLGRPAVGPPPLVVSGDVMGDLVRLAAREAGVFDLVAPSGRLSVTGRWSHVDVVRVELPPGEMLSLQTIALLTPAGESAADGAVVTASSWRPQVLAKFTPARLQDLAHPTGAAVHTLADAPAWVEIALPAPVDLGGIELRNVASPANCVRARRLRVLVRSGGRWSTVQDLAIDAARVDNALAEAVREHPAGDTSTDWIRTVLAPAATGDYPTARTAFDAVQGLSEAEKKRFRTTITEQILHRRRLEWTIHGPTRSFRHWSTKEKTSYVEFTAQVARDLATLSPDVCFGFGAALAVVRDHELIPHDDDLDLIMGFDPDLAQNLPEALQLVTDHLRGLGYTVAGNFAAHRHVSRGGRKHIDVFAGLFEGDTISWYPGTRGSLCREIMFPVSEGELLGVRVPLPREPETYLERVYGSTWNVSDPHFTHTWDRAAYADLQTRGTA